MHDKVTPVLTAEAFLATTFKALRANKEIKSTSIPSSFPFGLPEFQIPSSS